MTLQNAGYKEREIVPDAKAYTIGKYEQMSQLVRNDGAGIISNNEVYIRLTIIPQEKTWLKIKQTIGTSDGVERILASLHI